MSTTPRASEARRPHGLDEYARAGDPIAGYALNLESTVSALVDALRKYGEHRDDCGYWSRPNERCDCGLSEALAAKEGENE